MKKTRGQGDAGTRGQESGDPQLTGILREQVRVVLSSLSSSGRKGSLKVIATGLRAEGFEFKDAQLEDAVEWNHKRNLIDFEHNYTFARDEWYLTEKGENCA